MIAVTSRDQWLLKLLGRYELMTTLQIQTQVFSGVDKRTVLRRLRKLEMEKLIKRTYGLRSGGVVWSLTQGGAQRIQKEGFLDKINLNSLEHDVTLTQLRIALEEAGIASNWTTEQSIRRRMGNKTKRFGGEVCPDGIFAIKTDTGPEGIGLELELSGKNISRYTKIFEAYGSKKIYFAIWYVVTSKALGRKLQGEWSRVNPHITRPIFKWFLLEDLLARAQKRGAHTPAVTVGNLSPKNPNHLATTSSPSNVVPLPHRPLNS